MEIDPLQKSLDELLETLASVEHERWSHWQRYMHGKCIPQGDDGALLIPAEFAKRWEKQMATPYSELTDEEKESDREQVRTRALVCGFLCQRVRLGHTLAASSTTAR
jgi:hypothetical protein